MSGRRRAQVLAVCVSVAVSVAVGAVPAAPADGPAVVVAGPERCC